jgi:hypothetical protein
MWRTIYLMKLPRLAKKLRVTMGWTLDLFFGREIEQLITLRDIEAITERLTLIRNRKPGFSSRLKAESRSNR